MEHVIRLLKGRKSEVKLELSYCEEGNEHYDKVKDKLTEEIKQIDKSLLILSNVVGQSEQCCDVCDGYGYTVDVYGRRDKECEHCK